MDEPTFGVQEQAIVQSLPDAQVHVPLRRVQQQTVAQVVDVHVPHSALSGIVEQMVDVPVLGRISSDVSERIVEQMVDFPYLDVFPRKSLRELWNRWWMSPFSVVLPFILQISRLLTRQLLRWTRRRSLFKGFFALFPAGKKVRQLGASRVRH